MIGPIHDSQINQTNGNDYIYIPSWYSVLPPQYIHVHRL